MFFDPETKIPTLYGVGIIKILDWLRNFNPHRFGWGLKSSEIKISRT
jgi:hypothetical protein